MNCGGIGVVSSILTFGTAWCMSFRSDRFTPALNRILWKRGGHCLFQQSNPGRTKFALVTTLT